MLTFCSAYRDTGLELAVLGDRNRRVRHATVVGAGGGEHQSLHAGLARVGDEPSGRLHVDFVRELRVAPTCGVADDRGQMHDGVDACQRALARLGVANVGADHLDARSLLLGCDVVLAVEQGIQHANLVSSRAQLVHEQCADVSAAARH